MVVLKTIITHRKSEGIIAVIKTNHHRNKVNIKQRIMMMVGMLILMKTILNHKKVITFKKHSAAVAIMQNHREVS